MKTILLADDEIHLRTLVRATLDDPAYRIVEATDGMEALRATRRERPDLAILDWMMPGASGIDVVRALRRDPATAATPVIMLTAKGQEKDRQQALAAGCQRFLVKPFSPLELIDAVRAALEDRSRSCGQAATPDSALPRDVAPPAEKGETQLALYARDLKRAVDLERARAAELAAANARLENLSQLKSDFLAFISHELRTPLNAMSAVGLIDADSDAEERAQVIELVREGYERLQRLVQKGLEYFQWLAIDRIEGGHAVDATDVVERAAAAVPGLRAPGTEFQLNVTAGPCPVRGRAEDLAEAVRILVDNAIKHSRREKRVVVAVRSRGDRVAISVSDRGVGLRPEMLREVFRPFTSGDARHHAGGTGLNLALAERIVEAHGGTIRAESDGPGAGATFTIELPSAAEPARVAASTARS